jgi:hypothetical protein
MHSVPRQLLEIQSIPPHWHRSLISAIDPILVVTMSGVAETFTSVIDAVTYGSDCNVVNLLHADNADQTPEDVDTGVDETECRWNIHLVSYDTITFRAKQSSNSLLSNWV